MWHQAVVVVTVVRELQLHPSRVPVLPVQQLRLVLAQPGVQLRPPLAAVAAAVVAVVVVCQGRVQVVAVGQRLLMLCTLLRQQQAQALARALVVSRVWPSFKGVASLPGPPSLLQPRRA